MKYFAALLLVLAMATVANAANPVNLGYSDQTTIIGPGADACASGVLYVNHDGSFENGYAWQYAGSVAPYYGAYGEGYDLGSGGVCCVALYLSTLPGLFFGQLVDVYVWNGGVGGAPGAVIGLQAGLSTGAIAFWPAISQHDFDMNVNVTGPFTVGMWGNWPGQLAGWYVGADLTGFGGFPWTNIAPGIGYPTGWQDPSIVFGPTMSMGCGAYFTSGGPCGPIPADPDSWGSIKALFE